MKNLATTFAIAALTATTFFSNASNSGVAPTKTNTFEVGMYQSINTSKMNILIEKNTDKNLTVILKNGNGEELYSERISKSSKSFHAKFDMSDLADGKYTFEFIQGSEKIVKEVNIATQTVTQKNRQIVID